MHSFIKISYKKLFECITLRYYYKNFPALGKRAPEPHLPARKPNQPRVTCDEYEQGSCRWYDEWNYEHIVEYTTMQHNLL